MNTKKSKTTKKATNASAKTHSKKTTKKATKTLKKTTAAETKDAKDGFDPDDGIGEAMLEAKCPWPEDVPPAAPQGFFEVKSETNSAEQYMHFRQDTKWKLFIICNGTFSMDNFNTVAQGIPDQDFRRENLFVINNGERRIDLSNYGIDFMNTAEVPGWKDLGPKYSEYSTFYNLSTLFRNKLSKIPAIGFVHYDMRSGTGFRENPSLYSAIEFTYIPQSERWGLMMFSFEEYTRLYNKRYVMDYDQPQIFRYGFGHDLMYADKYGFLHNMADTCMQILNSEYRLAIGDPDRFTSEKLAGGRTFIMCDTAFLCGSEAAIDIMDMVRRVIDSGCLRPFENSSYERAVSQYLSCLTGIYSTKYATRTCFAIPHDAVLSRMEKLRE